MIRRFISYYEPVKRMFFFDMLCSFTVAIINMINPIVTRQFMRSYLPDKNLRAVVQAVIFLFVLVTIKRFLAYYIQYNGHMVGVHMQGSMRKEVFAHLEKLPFSYFDNNQTGKIMSRIVNDLQDISELAHHGPEDLFVSSVMLVGSFIYLCTINVPLTIIVFSLIPVLIIFAMKKRKKLSDTTMQTRVELASVNAGLESSISGIRVTRAFAAESYEEQKFDRFNTKNEEVKGKNYRAIAEFFSGTGYIIDILLLVVLLFAGVFAVSEFTRGTIDTTDLVTYVLFFSTFIEPIRKLINFVEQLQAGTTGFSRFCALLDEEPEWEKETAKPLESVSGNIVFEDVAFSYDEESEVFKNISLNIEQGQTVAFVGPSGGGKTTLCHLIPRFYDVTGGVIRLDGKDITEITRRSLRQNIGIVQQDTFLFTGTVRENIMYGTFDATEEEIIDAAKKANIHEHIMSLPNGYDTEVGERGTKLSGGQKQRISIARVFLKDPAILILDEATSALDNTTEILIQESLDTLSKGRTTLVVAHRLSTIRKADKIFVISGDGVKESGSHSELLEKGGVYAALYDAQFQLHA